MADFKDYLTDKKFNGHISLETIEDGIDTIIENVKTLLDDIQVLLDNKRYARSFSLAITVLEEVGKISVLVKMANLTPRTQKLWKECWAEYRDHNRKSSFGFVQSLLDQNRGGKIEDLLKLALNQFMASDAIERLRQLGLYVDYNSEKKLWTAPKDLPAELAEGVVNLATQAVNRVANLQQAGLYSLQVLSLKQKLYGSLQEEFNSEPVTPERLDYLMKKGIEIHKEVFRELAKIGIDISEDELLFRLE